MDFGVEFVPKDPVRTIVGYAKTADKLGFDFMWITDHYNNRNVYATLASIARETREIRLGPGVTNPYTIHPAETASSIATIDELSGGRAVLGIGPGDRTTLNALGMKWEKPLTRVKESIKRIRDLLEGESVTSEEGEEFNLRGCRLNFSPERKIPIYIGAQGPNMLKMAASCGDGILINASHPRDFEYAIERVKEGTKEAGRNLSDVDVAAYTSFSVGEDKTSAKESVIPPVAFIVAGVPEKVLERHEISSDNASEIKEALSKGDFGAAFGAVTSKMINVFSICGTPNECIERIRELKKIGVSQLVVGSPIGPDKKNSMKIISEDIKPAF
ncbi:methylene-tetrahydromethanopterin reductase [candidate division MSBL1 archaeon SCGC-AAA261C02]|uniref:5,10-methylenetetrahydromethanopterin reductase n=1 Tax=candidate division MSBL1 archaeon SCGC-AAA261C02 TaxID=1698272 RepID=A0A133V152_9EURY|nr:methylene-tetrahydromethanopterin reductase [candidate division MSBL1 archaeon SCGC-AAA261C02]